MLFFFYYVEIFFVFLFRERRGKEGVLYVCVKEGVYVIVYVNKKGRRGKREDIDR